MKKILSVTLSLITFSCCFLVGNHVQRNSEVFAEDKSVYDEYIPTQTVSEKLISMKDEYPEGMKWTNENVYAWNGGIYSRGGGCVSFAFILSDSIFGDLPASKHTDFSQIKVGDIVRLYNDSHSVVVLKKQDNILTVAEGNYNSSVHWGREIDISDSKTGLTYVMTRYPKCGDINGNNDINAEDASLVLAEYSALSTSSLSTFDDVQKWKADIDGNGKTDSNDASAILAFYAYLSTNNGTSNIDIREWINK
ncbi:MAG: hypothetical protein K2N27_08700 [Ruminococcus sp.]|nr:hypothetical protein [Ruminococcus sp.]